jgi:DNA-binding NarL/FixJ family response regulator
METKRQEPAAAAPEPVEDEDAAMIAIIDPRTLARDSLTRALQADHARFQPVPFARIDHWLQHEARLITDAILLGIGATPADHPGLLHDLQLLVRDFHHIPTLVMGDIEDPHHVVKILAAGARGYIPTSVSLPVAISAISLARAGGLFAPASSLLLSQQTPRNDTANTSHHTLLTERQAAVANAIARGKANKIIAYELNLCESTVKVHVRSIMKKLGAKNRTEVAFKLHSMNLDRQGPRDGWLSSAA